nr:hypothetical protein CFP56_33695 [Quercus suber]
MPSGRKCDANQKYRERAWLIQNFFGRLSGLVGFLSRKRIPYNDSSRQMLANPTLTLSTYPVQRQGRPPLTVLHPPS